MSATASVSSWAAQLPWRRRLSPFAIMAVSAFAMMLGAVVFTLSGFAVEGGAVAVAGLIPLFVALDRKLTPSLLVGPCTVAALFHLLGYIVGPLGQIYLSSVGVVNFSIAGMQLAQWGAFMGLFCFLPSYAVAFLAGSRGLTGGRGEGTSVESQQAWDSYGLLLLGATALMLVFGYLSEATRRIGGFRETSALVATIAVGFANVHQIVFFFLAFSAAKRRTFVRIGIWLVALGGYAGFFFLEGGRGTVIFAGLYSAIGLVAGGVSRRAVVTTLAVGAAVMIPVNAVVAEYRSYTAYSDSYDQGFGARMQQMIAAGTNLFTGNTDTPFSALDSNIYAATAVAVDRVMVMTPDVVDYQGFENLERALLIWVPRFITPAKLSVQDGNEAAFRYGVGTLNGTSFMYMPTVGEGYRRFGWAGIIILYSLLGLLFGFIAGFAWRFRARRDWAGVLMFVTVATGGAWSSTILSISYEVGWVIPKYIAFFVILRIVQDSVVRVSRRLFPGRTVTAPAAVW